MAVKDEVAAQADQAVDLPLPGDFGGDTTGYVDWCTPPSMAPYSPEAVAPPLLYPLLELVPTVVPWQPDQLDRYWRMGEVKGLEKIAPTGSLRLGDKVGLSNLPTGYLLTQQVLKLGGEHLGYACPCGTHLTKNKE